VARMCQRELGEWARQQFAPCGITVCDSLSLLPPRFGGKRAVSYVHLLPSLLEILLCIGLGWFGV